MKVNKDGIVEGINIEFNNIDDVSNRRELLIAFFDSVDENDIKKQKEGKGWKVVDNYLKAINCC